MIMNSSYLLVSDSNVWVLGGFSFILAQKINDGNMEINHTPTFIIEPLYLVPFFSQEKITDIAMLDTIVAHIKFI